MGIDIAKINWPMLSDFTDNKIEMEYTLADLRNTFPIYSFGFVKAKTEDGKIHYWIITDMLN